MVADVVIQPPGRLAPAVDAFAAPPFAVVVAGDDAGRLAQRGQRRPGVHHHRRPPPAAHGHQDRDRRQLGQFRVVDQVGLVVPLGVVVRLLIVVPLGVVVRVPVADNFRAAGRRRGVGPHPARRHRYQLHADPPEHVVELAEELLPLQPRRHEQRPGAVHRAARRGPAVRDRRGRRVQDPGAVPVEQRLRKGPEAGTVVVAIRSPLFGRNEVELHGALPAWQPCTWVFARNADVHAPLSPKRAAPPARYVPYALSFRLIPVSP